MVEFADSDIDELIGLDELLLPERRAEARAVAEAASAAERAVAERAAQTASVSEAEEELARTEADLARLRRLDEILGLTRRFLADAQERAYRTIAPILASAVRTWLGDVTTGRYTEVAVDPETLQVRVRSPNGRWRDADRLSHGTAEQIYLMLRVALADHLVSAGTVSPLLLDDVTVHADTERTNRILKHLMRIAERRQVVLFTARADVRDWAHTRLREPRHALRQLAAVTRV